MERRTGNNGADCIDRAVDITREGARLVAEDPRLRGHRDVRDLTRTFQSRIGDLAIKAKTGKVKGDPVKLVGADLNEFLAGIQM